MAEQKIKDEIELEGLKIEEIERDEESWFEVVKQYYDMQQVT